MSLSESFDEYLRQRGALRTPFFLQPNVSSLPSRNIVHKWMAVQRHAHRPNAGAENRKKIYLNLVPDTTYYRVEDELPSVSLRKFSPCGRYLAAFSRSTSIHSLEVFRVQSGIRPLSARELRFEGPSPDNPPTQLWSKYFRPLHSVPLSMGPDQVNKDFCLFTPHSRHVIVASTQPAQKPAFSVHHAQSAETLKSIPNLEDITLYVIDLQHGSVTAKHTFATDCINLTHNVGIYLEGNRLAVLSLLRQQIQLFTVREDGSLLHLMSIGEYCHADEALFRSYTPWLAEPPAPADLPAPTSLSSILEPVAPSVEEERPTHVFLGGLKQRLLSVLFLQAKAKRTLPRFYDRFGEYAALALLKIQILDEQHLLLKFGSPDAASNRISDPNSTYALFAFYNFITTQMVAVYDNDSQELLNLYEQLTDYFRPAGSCIPSPMNSPYMRQHFHYTLESIRAARNGGIEQALRRGIGSLPSSAQTFRESPYFDLGLFSHDERLISHTDRIRQGGDFPAKFYSRIHGGVAFSIPTGPPGPRSSRAKRLVSYLFHPFLPLVISVQHTIQPGMTLLHTNLHFRS